MKFLSVLLPLLGAAGSLYAQGNPIVLVVTASNAANNQLMVYNSTGKLLQAVNTQGKGGASGNAGGIAAQGDLVAVVNFGSQSVSIFERVDNGFQMTQLVPTVTSPVSVAFGSSHLYILGTTKVESHQMFGPVVSSNPDGAVTLLTADGSSAQVGVLPTQLIVTEKSNMIETVSLSASGAVNGAPTAVANIPDNVNAPFGLITRGDNAYVTIAHADEISLVRGGKVLTVTPSNTQHAPCWVALNGAFLYSSNSPSMTISRYAVYGQKLVQDLAMAAQLGGSPSDIASVGGLLAVIDGSGPLSHLSIFTLDEDGNLTLQNAATISGAATGVAIIPVSN